MNNKAYNNKQKKQLLCQDYPSAKEETVDFYKLFAPLSNEFELASKASIILRRKYIRKLLENEMQEYDLELRKIGKCLYPAVN